MVQAAKAQHTTNATYALMLRWGDWKRFSGGFVALPHQGRLDANRAVVEVIA